MNRTLPLYKESKGLAIEVDKRVEALVVDGDAHGTIIFWDDLEWRRARRRRVLS